MRNSSKAITLYLFSLFGYTFTNGAYNARLLYILFFVLVLSWIFFFSKVSLRFLKINFEDLLLTVFLLNSFLFVFLFGGIYQLDLPVSGRVINIIIPAILFFSMLFLFDFKKLQTRISLYLFIILFFLGIVIKIALVVDSPKTTIDVYDMLKMGPAYLLAGKNPYKEMYIQRHPEFVPNYFTYFPITLFVFMPAQLLPDVRYIFIISDFLLVILLFTLMRKHLPTGSPAMFLAPLLYLLHPSSSYILEQSWMEPLLFMFLVLFIYTQTYSKDLSKYSFLVLSIFLGLKQTFIVLLPILFKFKSIKRGVIIASVVTMTLITLPFVLWSPSDFFNDTIKFFIDIPARYDSIVANTFIFKHLGINIPPWLFGIIWIAAFFKVLITKIESWGIFVMSLTVFLFTFYFFNKQAFVHYYYFISQCLLLASILFFIEENKKKV